MANGPRLRFSTTIMAIKVREFHYCETALLDYQTDYWTLLGENTLHDPNISERNGLKFMSAHFMVRLTQKHCDRHPWNIGQQASWDVLNVVAWSIAA